MNARRITLWILPFLFGGSLIYFFAIQPRVIQNLQNQESTFQAMRQEGWTTYLQEFSNHGWFSTLGSRRGEMAIDTSGRVWVAGGGLGLEGLHSFDGAEWTSRSGSYWDLAVGPHGQVWAVPMFSRAIDYFDGQQWRTFEGPDLGIGERDILQVETDSHGRVWIATTNIYDAEVAEIILQQDKATAIFSHPEFRIIDGAIISLDADNQGRIWAAVQNYTFEDADQVMTGLYVLDGETWQRVPEHGVDLGQVVRTAFDQQGNIWVFTEGRDVIRYDGKDWVTIIENLSLVNGISLDSQGRLWVWGIERVKFLDNDNWTTLIPENSGLAQARVFGLVVDGSDRIWIGTSEGVSMVAVQDAQPIPQKVVDQHRTLLALKRRTNGMDWFVPPALALAWLAVYFNLPGVILALVVGTIASVILYPPLIEGPYGFSYINPGVFATFFGVIGGLIGGKGRHTPDGKSKIWLNYMLAIMGLIVGFVLGYFWVAVTSP